MKKTWRSLILGGGGSNGEFQVGALKVIARNYNSFDFYAGVGIGALHSAVLAQNDSIGNATEILLHLWNDIGENADILDIPFLGAASGAFASIISDKSFARDGVYGNKKIRKIVEKHVDWAKLEGKENWAIEVTSLSDGRIYALSNKAHIIENVNKDGHLLKLSIDPKHPYFIGSKLVDFITAAVSLPFILPPTDIFGQRFMEGGLRDFVPLKLAVEAFEQAMKNGYTDAEFVIVNNYTPEANFESPEMLDSGGEIIIRALKIMTLEMAKNDLSEAYKKLEQYHDVTNVKIIHPSVDIRLSSFDYENLELRRKLRNNGESQADICLGHPWYDSFDKLLVAYNQLHPEKTEEENRALLIRLNTKNPEAINTIALSIITDPALNAEDLVRPLIENQKFPQNLVELKQMMKDAFALGQRIKSIGAGFAFSDILVNGGSKGGININLSKLNNIFFPKDDDNYNVVFKDQNLVDTLCEFEAGATIENLNEKLSTIGRALVNQPGYEKLNFFGVASCGGHGSGIDIPPICGSILSLTLISFDADGKLVVKRIEPENGITNPTQFALHQPAIQLIQDDQIFNACTVSFGSLGVVYSLIVATQPSFHLEEHRTLITVKDLKVVLPAKLLNNQIHSVHVWLNPYKVKGTVYCLLTEYIYHVGPAKGKQAFGVTWQGVDDVSPMIEWAMENFPSALANILHSSLKATVNSVPPVLTSPVALNFGTPNQVKVYATNVGIPVDKIFDAMDAIINLCDELFPQRAYVTSPIGFRFTSASQAFLAPQYNQKTCMIELPLLYNTDFAIDTINKFQLAMFSKFNGRPHWGQINRVINKEWMQRLFPALPEFIKVYKKLNCHGTFDSKFTDQLGLREMADAMA